MSRIRTLPPDLASKIAAGEVIERPVSVVKELVENALDAGATEVRVDLVHGGKSLIRVQDDGWGMDPEDAALCFRRHSTSKIFAEADLERISTLGFRGEALASISAVSRIVLRTNSGGPRGTMVEREGDKLVSISDTAFPRGTSVEVRDLFFNLPARRKFLRSDRAEIGLAARVMTQAALSRPGTRFVLTHGDREILNLPPVETLRERVYQLFGGESLEGLMEVDYTEDGARVTGFVSKPLAGRPGRPMQHLFINGRPVKDRILQAALSQAYRDILEKDRSPEAVLFLELPPEALDVNVHPAKAEIRFLDSQPVFRMILRAVEKAVIRETSVKDVPVLIERKTKPERMTSDDASPPLPGFGPDSAGGFVAEGFAGTWGAPPSRPGPRVLGQYLGLYIVAADEEGLLIIDQHNAHERVLFEKFREAEVRAGWPVKALLSPVLLELSPEQAQAFEDVRDDLATLGFRAEDMGGRSVALRDIPEILSPARSAEAFLALLDEAGPEKAEDRRERLLAGLACRAAVKAGETLTPEKTAYLVEELFKTDQPLLCPHGRPIVLRIERSRIDRGMGRPPR
ncbi:MAG: DNA mismatch repair endonuclease MutL [Acidobacteriota bacterium]|nr:DNA mismatch repair endonuclease MutL [Acidobacteriota bacterium]